MSVSYQALQSSAADHFTVLSRPIFPCADELITSSSKRNNEKRDFGIATSRNDFSSQAAGMQGIPISRPTAHDGRSVRFVHPTSTLFGVGTMKQQALNLCKTTLKAFHIRPLFFHGFFFYLLSWLQASIQFSISGRKRVGVFALG